MDNTTYLTSLSQHFSREALTVFLRAASGSFRPEKEDLNRLIENAPWVSDLFKLGQIDFGDGQRLVVLAGLVEKELTSQSGKQKQYEIAKKVLKQHFYDAGIFVFHDEAGHFRFSLITAQYKGEGAGREFSSSRRSTYFVSPEPDRNRTFIEQLGKADFSSIGKILEAFSVEPVTKEFFKEYRKIFEEAEAAIALDWNDEKKRLYTQRFFNRMMFIAFLERKGWLRFDADAGRKDYLRALFADYYANETNKRSANFHKSRLNTLFFRGLNSPQGDKLQSDPQYKIFRDLIGDVPYLNGGLFDEEPEDIDGPLFPDGVVTKILSDLVYKFNFTVTESTPLDIEVAVDPEMLGRIFEELVTGRHESGSYYTPKPVVAFMCREALKGYLGTALPGESDAALALFVDKNDPAHLRNPELTLGALKAVKVCDPACGSGAYLLGMLHELLEQRECLFAAHLVNPIGIYKSKLEIIQNNLYGVDLDPFAVNIARLRLWLSLIVDYEGDSPPPLPNLDFKIEPGDSLTAPDPSGGLQRDLFSSMVDDFLKAKNEYGTSHHSEKTFLREKVTGLRDQIKKWAGRSVDFSGFDWIIEFAEVFVPGERPIGFDIILANPPYVRADTQFKHIEDEAERQREIAKWQTYRAQLKDSGPKNDKVYKTLHEKWDLYVPFLERAHQLLRQNGQMIFIIPDAYNAAKYAGKSHEFFLQTSRIKRIDFCSEIDLFDAGVNNTILHFEKGAPTVNHQPVRVRRWGDIPDDFERNLQLLETKQQIEYDKSLFRASSEQVPVIDVNHVILENICYISKGMVVHAEEENYKGAFKLDDLISLTKDKEHPKPFVEGKDFAKWIIRRHKWLEYGTKRAPSQFSRPTFPELYEATEKLISMDIASGTPRVVYDANKFLHNHSAWSFVPWHLLKNVINKSINKTAKYHHQDPLGKREQREETSRQFNLKYVLAIMNSSFAREWLKSKRRSKMHIYPDDWKQLPIAPIALETQIEFVALVDQILAEYKEYGYPLPEASKENVRGWEGQLDAMVTRLYE